MEVRGLIPQTYNFYIVNDGIDKQSSMLRSKQTHRRRLSSTPLSPKEGRLRHRQTSVSQPGPNPKLATNANSDAGPTPAGGSDDKEVAELEKSMSALQFVPASVQRNNKFHGRVNPQ